jgi:hypothetical protein
VETLSTWIPVTVSGLSDHNIYKLRSPSPVETKVHERSNPFAIKSRASVCVMLTESCRIRGIVISGNGNSQEERELWQRAVKFKRKEGIP